MNKNLDLLYVCLYNAFVALLSVGGFVYLIKDRNYWGLLCLVAWMYLPMSYHKGSNK